MLLVPAGLDIGDHFYHEDFGSIPITENEYFTYAEAKRTLVFSHIGNIGCLWDKTTGILVQSDQSEDNSTQTLLAVKTNMWQPQILGLDATIFYILIVVILTIIALFLFSY